MCGVRREIVDSGERASRHDASCHINTLYRQKALSRDGISAAVVVVGRCAVRWLSLRLLMIPDACRDNYLKTKQKRRRRKRRKKGNMQAK